jgi:hypothetical protein
MQASIGWLGKGLGLLLLQGGQVCCPLQVATAAGPGPLPMATPLASGQTLPLANVCCNQM